MLMDPFQAYRTVDGTPFMCAEQFVVAENSRFIVGHLVLQTIVRVSDPKLHRKYGHQVRNLNAIVWEHERENSALHSPKFQPCNSIGRVPATGCLSKLVLTILSGI